MHYKGNLHRKSLPEYEMRFSFLFYELAGFRVQSYVHKHTQTHTCLITCKYWHLKVSSCSLLQNYYASWEKLDNLLFDPTSIPPSPQPKHTTIAAGKLNTGRFYEDILPSCRRRHMQPWFMIPWTRTNTEYLIHWIRRLKGHIIAAGLSLIQEIICGNCQTDIVWKKDI